MAEAEGSDVEDGMSTHVLQEFLLEDVEICGRELGVGSYSSVLELKYKGMRCAGKKIHRSLYDQGVAVGPEILERYEKECELLSHLRHPCVVQFLGLFLDVGEDVPILVMEYLSCALSDCIDMHGHLASEICYSILHDVALGLRYLHDHEPPIIHRDLTANNVLLSSSMKAKISDLGMAKILNLAPAQMTHRMTVCPGTISYMPPEALIAEPLYDTKLDCFSFGVLMIHIFCGEWPIALEYLQPDASHPGRYVPLTEIERREKYLRHIGYNHPLIPLIRRCLGNIPAERPEVSEILNEVSTMVARYPPIFDNHVEMLERIRHDEQENNRLRLEVDQLRKLLHEKEHEVENLRFTTAGEIETLREQIVCLESSRVLQEAQVLELQSENKRMHQSIRELERELSDARSRVEQLSVELESATSTAQEHSHESLTRLRQLQNELTSSSKEREAVLKRLAKGHLEATVKHVFKNTTADELSKNYDEFFLNKADDIADQLKMAPGVNDFEAHQMVCDMVQQSYNHCKTVLLEEVRGALDRLFTHEGHTSLEALHDTQVAYGLLLRAVQSQKPPRMKAISDQVFKKLQEKSRFKRAIQLSRSAMHRHVDQACKLMWSLVCVSPPIIVCQPTVIREEWQDREFEYWDKSLSSYRLTYTRPVLFHNYEGMVGVKGWVGNKRIVGSPKVGVLRTKSSS